MGLFSYDPPVVARTTRGIVERSGGGVSMRSAVHAFLLEGDNTLYLCEGDQWYDVYLTQKGDDVTFRLDENQRVVGVTNHTLGRRLNLSQGSALAQFFAEKDPAPETK
jgi:hypothetical protein